MIIGSKSEANHLINEIWLLSHHSSDYLQFLCDRKILFAMTPASFFCQSSTIHSTFPG